MGDVFDWGPRLRFASHRRRGPVSIDIGAYPAGGGVAEHDHADFAEVFWVVRGTCEHRWHDAAIAMPVGHCQFVRREDRHGYRVLGSQGAGIVNIAIRHDLLARWRRQAVFGAAWPWDDPRPVRLDHLQLERLAQALATMPAEPGPLDHLWLVAGIAREVAAARARRAVAAADPPPSWLAEALARWRKGAPEADVPVLARWSGRSREHLARTVRRHFGVSPSTLLNHLRLERAAEQLRAGERPVLAIALDCGFGALSHFYRCFQARFGVAPTPYRQAFRGVAAR